MFNEAEDFLKQSMERHRALKTYRAKVAWDLMFEQKGQWASSGARPRTIAYVAPNRFRIQHGDARLYFLYICNGKEYVVLNHGFSTPPEKKPLPDQLATSDLVNGHPHFGCSFLYAFFGGAQNLPMLLGTANPVPIRFGDDVTIEGEPCKTLVFGGGIYYKERRAMISIRDGLVRQVEGIDAAKPRGKEEIEESRRTLARVKATPQWKAMTDEQKRELERQYLVTQIPAARTVETVSDLMVNQPIPDSEFAMELSAAQKAKMKEEEERLSRGITQKPGDPAPDFKAVTLATGKPLTLASLKGRVVMIDLWATWCPPCVRGLPETLALQKEYAGKGLVVLAISDEKSAPVTAFLQTHPELKGLNVLISDEASRRFGVRAIPTVVIVGRDGKIVASFLGLQEAKTLRRALAEAGLR
jgi:thiol-disulfide isomerase/thioredoxin